MVQGFASTQGFCGPLASSGAGARRGLSAFRRAPPSLDAAFSGALGAPAFPSGGALPGGGASPASATATVQAAEEKGVYAIGFSYPVVPRGEARPHWALAAELGTALGLELRFASAREAFRALAGRLGGALGDCQWDALPSAGKGFGIVPLAAGTVDGRLAGNRDRVPSETTEDWRRALARTS